MGNGGVTGESEQPEERLNASELYHKLFPEYLAMGMTYRQFWDEDCRLVIAYRKAYQIRQEEQNRLAWLNGLYIYKALQSTPIVVHGFAKSGTKVEPYPNKPIDFTPEKPMTAQEKADKEAQEQTEKIKRNMMEFMRLQAQDKKERELKALLEGGGEDVRSADAVGTGSAE